MITIIPKSLFISNFLPYWQALLKVPCIQLLLVACQISLKMIQLKNLFSSFVPGFFQTLLSVRLAIWSINNCELVENMLDLLRDRETILRYGVFEPIDRKIKEQLAATELSQQSLNNGRMNVQIISWLYSLIALFLVNQQNMTSSIILSIYLASGQIMQSLRESINDFAAIKK